MQSILIVASSKVAMEAAPAERPDRLLGLRRGGRTGEQSQDSEVSPPQPPMTFVWQEGALSCGHPSVPDLLSPPEHAYLTYIWFMYAVGLYSSSSAFGEPVA